MAPREHRSPIAALCLAALAFAMPGREALACSLKPKAAHVAVRVIDGQTVGLDDGRVLRLAGILAPRAPPDAGLGASWPAADAAKAALERIVLGKRLHLAFAARGSDRYGRLVAHAFIGEGKERDWVEERIAREGQARIDPAGGSRTCAAELLAAETEARAAGRGLWAEPYYALKDAGRPDDLLRSELRFEIVEGLVQRVSASRSAVFIEFGRRWREDFTVLVRGRDRQAFAKAGIDLALLAGRRIRVRGYIERRNGPLMRVSAPESIEIITR